MNIIEKALNLIRRKKVMSKIVIKHHSGHMKGEVYVYGRNYTIWPDGSETKVPGGHNLEELLNEANKAKSDGLDITITQHYERI